MFLKQLRAVVNGICVTALLNTFIVQQNIIWQVKMDFILLAMQQGLNTE